MKKGDICEVVGDIGKNSKYYSVGDKCELISYKDFHEEWHCNFKLNENYNGDGAWNVNEKNLRPILGFKRGDKVVCGNFNYVRDFPGEYYGTDNESEHQHLVRMADGIIRAWRYCEKAEPEIKKDTKVMASHGTHQWDKRYATGKFINGKIQCYSDGADSWSGNDSYYTCWKNWKLYKE